MPDDTHIGKWQQQSGRLDHDQFLTPLARALIEFGTIAIDVGAFDGDHTIVYSDKVGPNGHVYAFEPGKTAFNCLEHNVTQFPTKNVTPLNMALGIGPGSVTVHEDANLGASRATPCDHVSTPVAPLRSLDGVMEDYPDDRRISFIKIDAEGWERDILVGAYMTISKHRPRMLLEVNPGALAARKPQQTVDVLRGTLETLKYNATIVQPECKWDSPQFDILCIPR